MTVIKLDQYGSILTGREFGADVMKALSAQVLPPLCLDFEGVEVIGSSFGDEVIPGLAAKQSQKLKIKNANETVKSILKDIAADAGIEIEILL